jgi:hypothetical protein
VIFCVIARGSTEPTSLGTPACSIEKKLSKLPALQSSTAKLGEKFQYQNVMFSAAGEVVAHAQGSTWERIIAERIFRPLGMNLSNTSAAETQKSPDFAIGYDIAKKTPKKLAMRDLTNIAPAGAINSNAVDMAKWLRLMLGAGVFEGKRLVSEKSFNELITKQITVAGTTGYGLGWGVTEWHGHKVLTHSGGIDGFNSMVGLMPDQKVGFALLTNVSSSPIGLSVRDAIFNNLVGMPETMAAASTTAGTGDAALEAGSYSSGGLVIEVVLKDGKLIAKVAGQPDYPLINVGGRKYKLDDPAPSGFFMTFRPMKSNESDTEMFLEQPQGNVVLAKRKAEGGPATKAASADYSGPHRDLLGKYERGGMAIEVTAKDGKVAALHEFQRGRSLDYRNTTRMTGNQVRNDAFLFPEKSRDISLGSSGYPARRSTAPANPSAADRADLMQHAVQLLTG